MKCNLKNKRIGINKLYLTFAATVIFCGCSGLSNSGIKVLSDSDYGCNKLLRGLYLPNGYPSENKEQSINQLNKDMVECWSVTYRSIYGENSDPVKAWQW